MLSARCDCFAGIIPRKDLLPRTASDWISFNGRKQHLHGKIWLANAQSQTKWEPSVGGPHSYWTNTAHHTLDYGQFIFIPTCTGGPATLWPISILHSGAIDVLVAAWSSLGLCPPAMRTNRPEDRYHGLRHNVLLFSWMDPYGRFDKGQPIHRWIRWYTFATMLQAVSQTIYSPWVLAFCPLRYDVHRSLSLAATAAAYIVSQAVLLY